MKSLSYILVMLPLLAACWNTSRASVTSADTDESSVRQVFPGDTLTAEFVNSRGLDSLFSIQPVPDDIFTLMQGKTFKADCTVSRNDLRYLLCLHRDKDGNILVGEMVVAASIAEDLLEILKELYVNAYPIERMRLPDYWNAEDEAQMRANNSSSFNFRFVSHTKTVSKHGLGVAVDINPLYNPYVKTLSDGTESVEPATARAYIDRKADFPYKVEAGDLCVRLFKAHGFTWGGDWKSCKDWQHFQR